MTDFDTIIHLADIHIRPLARHDEYNAVFDTLYAKIAECGTKRLIIVAGDILHVKDQLKPETFILTRKFFIRLRRLGTLIIIAGNHDIPGVERMDNISALVDRITKIHYIQFSGVFDFGNITVVVQSLLDDLRITREEVDTDTPICICLYHGCVDQVFPGCKSRSSAEFAGYTATLLGDIHKRTDLNQIKGGCVYPGSLIQQNFAEDEEHGFISWDVNGAELVPKFVVVPNSFGHVTLTTSNLNGIISSFPKNTYLRLSNIPIGEHEDLIKFVGKLTNIINVKYKNKNIIEEYAQTGPDDKYYEMASDEELIRNAYIDLKELVPNSTNRIDEILKLHQSISSASSVVPSTWTVESVKFQNVYIYGESHENILNCKKGVTGIIAPNAMGKSTLFYIVNYALFNHKNITDLDLGKMLNNKSKTFRVECTFIHAGCKYRITKCNDVNKVFKHKSAKLEKFNSSTGRFQDISKETIKVTIDYVYNLLGGAHFILKCVYNKYNESIFKLTPSVLNTTLTELFDLNRYTNAETMAKNKIKLLQNAKIATKSKLSQHEFTPEVDESICKIKANIAAILENIDAHATNIEDKLILLSSQLEMSEILGTELDAKHTIKKTAKLEEQIKTLKESLNNNIPIDIVYDAIDDFDPTTIVNYVPKQYKKRICDEHQKMTFNAIIKRLNMIEVSGLMKPTISKANLTRDKNEINARSMSKLDVFYNLPEIQLIEGYYVVPQKTWEEIRFNRALISRIKDFQDLISINDELKKWKLYETDAAISREVEALEDVLLNKYWLRLAKQNSKIRNEIDGITQQINAMKLHAQSITNWINNEKIRVSIVELRKSNNGSKQRKELENAQSNLMIAELAKKANAYNISFNAELDAIQSDLELYEDYCALVTQRNIPVKIVLDKLKSVQSYINKYLPHFVTFSLKIDAVSKSKTGEVSIKFETICKTGAPVDIKLLSGYESFILNILTKVALNKFTFHSKSEIFFIDEGLDCIDSANLLKFGDLLAILKAEFTQIYLITHLPNIRSHLNNTIEIDHNKISGSSQIRKL
jgi:DNA repair exonuclease SbcCD nuclease subunit